MVGFAPSWWGLFRQNQVSLVDKFSPAKTAKSFFSSAKICVGGDECQKRS
jgi:hypothetical protein